MSSQPEKRPFRRFNCILDRRNGSYFEFATGIWWAGPENASKFGSPSRAQAYCYEFLLLHHYDIVAFLEEAPPVTGFGDDSDGEWWKD